MKKKKRRKGEKGWLGIGGSDSEPGMKASR